MTRILGAILAGGQSRRFGTDKAVALLHGVSLLDHGSSRLEPQVDAMIVCGREIAGRSCVPDHPRPGLGPLGGLAAALRYGHAHGFDLAASIGCDTPFFPADLVATLIGEGVPCHDAAQPIIGVWPVALADHLERFLSCDGAHSMRLWASLVCTRMVELPSAIPNINFRHDLESLAFWDV